VCARVTRTRRLDRHAALDAAAGRPRPRRWTELEGCHLPESVRRAVSAAHGLCRVCCRSRSRSRLEMRPPPPRPPPRAMWDSSARRPLTHYARESRSCQGPAASSPEFKCARAPSFKHSLRVARRPRRRLLKGFRLHQNLFELWEGKYKRDMRGYRQGFC
jgi:hypothetical protein